MPNEKRTRSGIRRKNALTRSRLVTTLRGLRGKGRVKKAQGGYTAGERNSPTAEEWTSRSNWSSAPPRSTNAGGNWILEEMIRQQIESGSLSNDYLRAQIANLLGGGSSGGGSAPPWASSEAGVMAQLGFEREQLAQQVALARDQLAQEGRLTSRQLDIAEEQMRGQLGISQQEVDLAKEQLTVQKLLGLRSQMFQEEMGRGELSLGRRAQTLAENQARAEAAANPRRIFESIFLQSGQQPTEAAKAFQSIATGGLPGYRSGGIIGSLADALEVQITGKKKRRPDEGEIILVGEGKGGLKRGSAEYVVAPPGTIVAPAGAGEEPTAENARRAIAKQIAKASKGYPSARKASIMLHEGEVRGEPISEKQRRFFGFLAGGGKPTRAQGGYWNPPNRQSLPVAGTQPIQGGGLFSVPAAGGQPYITPQEQLRPGQRTGAAPIDYQYKFEHGMTGPEIFRDIASQPERTNPYDVLTDAERVFLLVSELSNRGELSGADLNQLAPLQGQALLDAFGQLDPKIAKLIGQELRGEVAGGSAAEALMKTMEPIQDRLQESIRRQATKVGLGGTKPRGTGLFDFLGGSTFTPEQAGQLRRINARDYGNLSTTQQGVLDATLSMNQVEPNDFMDFLRKSYQGFNPVQSAASSRFGGILG